MARCSHHRTSGQLASGGAIASVICAGSFLGDICLSLFRNKKRCSGGADVFSGHWQMGWLKKPMCCGGECSALRWLMQHAAVAVAPRCADGVNNFDIHFHEIHLPLPAILVFVPTNSSSCFHESCRSFPRIWIFASIKSGIRPHRFKFLFPLILSFLSTNPDSRFHRFGRSFPRIQTPAFTNSHSHSHEFQHLLPPILTFLSTNVGKQKRHPFVGMSFSIAFPLSGGAWRIRTAVDGFADR